MDPLQGIYPSLTPYQFGSNNTISGVDIDGREIGWYLSEKLEKAIFGTTHLEKIRDGFIEQATKQIKSLISPSKVSKDFINQFVFDPRTTLSDPTIATKNTQQMYQNGAYLGEIGKDAIKGMAQEYGSLLKKAAKGDMKAVGALGFEVVLFAAPGGEESKTVGLVPRGFKNAEQFAKVGEELGVALEKSGIKYEQIGIRGSSVSGLSSKGGGFRYEAVDGFKASDIDAFVILKEDISVSGGATRPDFVHPDKMMKKYPELKAWSEKWTKILGREITPAGIKPAPKTN